MILVYKHAAEIKKYLYILTRFVLFLQRNVVRRNRMHSWLNKDMLQNKINMYFLFHVSFNYFLYRKDERQNIKKVLQRLKDYVSLNNIFLKLKHPSSKLSHKKTNFIKSISHLV